MNEGNIQKAVGIIGALALLVPPLSKLAGAIRDQIEEGHARRVRRRIARRAARLAKAAGR